VRKKSKVVLHLHIQNCYGLDSSIELRVCVFLNKELLKRWFFWSLPWQLKEQICCNSLVTCRFISKSSKVFIGTPPLDTTIPPQLSEPNTHISHTQELVFNWYQIFDLLWNITMFSIIQHLFICLSAHIYAKC
jgi:hypothetical protein